MKHRQAGSFSYALSGDAALRAAGSRWGVRTTVLCLAACAVFLASGLFTASRAEAYSQNYCGWYVASSSHCLASGKHTWNYNLGWTRSGVSLINMCAYISTGTDGSGAIYGSGCWGNSNWYQMCHAPVVNTYWAFVSHLQGGSTPILDGYAETGVNCGGGFAARTTTRANTEASERKLADTISAFRDRPAEKSVPAMVRSMVARGAASPQDPGMNLGEARAVGPEGLSILAAPSKEGVCAAITIADGEAAAIGCSKETDVLSGFTATENGQTAWGVVPDGVKAVAAKFPDGTQQLIGVERNGFAQSFDVAPVELTPVR